MLHNVLHEDTAMTPADQRIAALLDRWIASIELHLRYTELADDDYWQVQQWPRHERPTRWVLEVARQKLLELKNQCDARRELGDARFAESLELMAFLANLVGLQHIQRFVPLATGQPASAQQSEETVETKRPAPAKTIPRTDDATREMPKLKTAAPAKAATVTSPKQPTSKAESRKPAPIAKASGPVPVAMTPQLQTKIVADAVRLLKWGKQWHELGDLIARIADRPPIGEIRKVLRTNKAEIESKAARK
jgi:hypothetical protein